MVDDERSVSRIAEREAQGESTIGSGLIASIFAESRLDGYGLLRHIVELAPQKYRPACTRQASYRPAKAVEVLAARQDGLRCQAFQ
jgi:hypothetical protein